MSRPVLGVVVVLHRTDPRSSAALGSLGAHLRPDDGVVVLVQDNTDDRDTPVKVPPIMDEYIARPDNPGLAQAYTAAAQTCSARGAGWLMLLDQDTEVTREYLDEVLAIAGGRRRVPDDVGVLVPTLHDAGRVLSPHGRVRLRTRPLRQRSPGPVREWCSHLNSGSVLRLAAVRDIGGFPADYPLDYLDHVVAARLRSTGRRTWLLASVLPHRLSLLERDTLPQARHRSVLDAEGRYYAEYGSREDLAWLALRRWLGVGLSAVRLRSTPSLADEASAAADAVRAATHRGAGAAHG